MPESHSIVGRVLVYGFRTVTIPEATPDGVKVAAVALLVESAVKLLDDCLAAFAGPGDWVGSVSECLWSDSEICVHALGGCLVDEILRGFVRDRVALRVLDSRGSDLLK